MPTKGLRKFKFERQLGRTILNPMVAALDRLGVRSSLVVELETTGRKSGEPRRVPLAGRADDRRLGDLAAWPPRRVGAQYLGRSARAGTGQRSMAQRHSQFRT